MLLELPCQIEKCGIKGLIVPIEDFMEVPSGLRRQVEEKCLELNLEEAFPKPFCSLEPSERNPTISRFVNDLRIGRPLLEIFTAKRDKYVSIDSTVVRRSVPCGSTWYIARKLVGVEAKRESPYDT